MAALLLYVFTTAAIIAVARRWVLPVSILVAAVLVLLPFCFVGKALLTGRVHGPIDHPLMVEPLSDYAADLGIERVHNGFLSDLYMQIIPWRAAVRHALGNGEWPLWNPHMLCGDVLAAAAQPGVYDPINLIGLVIPLPASVTFGNAMTLFLAGFFAFAFARLIGCSELASLLCAAGWMFNGALAFFVGWPLGRAWAYLPLVLSAVRLLAREANARATILLCVAFVLVIVAGHPESILHLVAIGAAYGIFEIWQQRDQARRAIVGALLAGIVALLATAIYLLPFFAALAETVQSAGRSQIYAANPLPTNPNVMARRLANTLVPFWGGQPQRHSYNADYDPWTARVGSVIVALAFLAPVLARRRRETWFFAGLLLITFCAGVEAPPVADLLHSLPLFDITLNERLITAASFAFCVLAALALDTVAADHRRFIAIYVAAVCILMVFLSMFLWPVQEERGIDRSLLGLLTIAELLPLAILFILLASKVPIRAVAVTAIALVLIQRYAVDGTIYPSHPARLFYPTVPLLDYIRDHIGQEPARVVGLQFAMIPNIATVYAFDDPRGYQAMTFMRLWATYPMWSNPDPISFNRVFDLSRPFLSMINAKFAITSKTALLPDGWRVVAEDRSTRVIENTRVLPRAFLPRWIRYEQNDTQTVYDMIEETDFAETGWIRAPEYKPHRIANGRGTLRTRRAGSRFEIAASMQNDGWVIVSESAWNGWRAYLDGRRVRIHYANNAFIGVFIPAGEHTLRLEYLPKAFTRGRNTTLVTLAALAVLAAATWIRRKSVVAIKQ